MLSVDQLVLELQASQQLMLEKAEDANQAEKKVEELLNSLRIVTEERNEIESELTVVKNQLSEAGSRIGELESKLEKEVAANPTTKESFELEGVKYEVLCGTTLDNVKLTALEIASDSGIQAKLVSIKSGVIKEIK